MSASREKKARQERGADYVSPKEEKARKQQAETRRTTVIFTICAIVFVLGVAAMLVWNSGVIQRGAAAVNINGETYTAADVAYYYYNARSNALNSGSSGLDSSKSARSQSYGDGSQTWFDYLSGQAVQSLTSAVLTAQAAKAAGFDGGEQVEKTVKDTLSSLETAASANGYTTTQYLKAIFGPLMTKGVFERNIRTAALADAYASSVSDAANYTDAELTAAYDADPDAYSMVSYEYAMYFASDYMPADTDAGTTESTESSETDTAAEEAQTAAALAATQEAAASASVRVKSGESLETIAAEANATYAASYAYYGTSDIAAWLFDDARQDGDVTVMDYYGAGTQVLVFHSKERADYHTVDVRHILVADEATANDLLAQYNAGEKTEDAFAALATENSTDTGSSSNGGLYEGVGIGQMVKPFEDWCFDASRQSGDTGIVQTDYGYHVMYFVGRSDYSYWQQIAANTLGSEKISAFTENAESQRLNGMKYIDA